MIALIAPSGSYIAIDLQDEEMDFYGANGINIHITKIIAFY